MKALQKPTSLILIIATAHKVGSTWLYQMLQEIPIFQTVQIPPVFNETGTLKVDNPMVLDYFRSLRGGFVFKSHSYPISYSIPKDFPAQIEFVTLFRDLRDVIISACFYLNKLSPELGGFELKYRRLPVHEQILSLIEGGRGNFILDRMEQWLRTERVYKLFYENLKKDPVEQLQWLMSSLDIPVDTWLLERIVEAKSFKAMSGREPGQENKNSELRKGIVGDWKNHFTPECITAFKNVCNGRWNKLLLNLGYERTPEW